MSKKFRVRSVEFRVHEDSFNDGEGNLLAIWTEENLPFRNTIEQALADIMHFCELQKDIKNFGTMTRALMLNSAGLTLM